MRNSGPRQALTSPSGMAVVGMITLLVGISLTSMRFGALTTPYYIVALTGLGLGMPFLLKHMYDKLPGLVLLVLSPLLLTILQYIFLDQYSFLPPSFLSSIGMGAVLLAAAITGSLPTAEFRRVMAFAALGHAAICAYGIFFWDFSSAAYGSANRFGTEEMGTAVWGELAVGTAIAAMLSGRRWLLWAIIPISGIIIYGTQMRGAGLATFISLFLYWFLTAGRKLDPLLLFAGICLAIAVGLMSMTELGSVIETALLLNDQHRGISSGFSGRLENWALAWERFVSSPLIGVGQSDRIAAAAHNGILKICAEYGVVFALTMLAFVLTGLRNAWRLRQYDIFAAIIGLIVFIGSAPRYINFQVMPFVSLAAVAFALSRPGWAFAPGRRHMSGGALRASRNV